MCCPGLATGSLSSAKDPREEPPPGGLRTLLLFLPSGLIPENIRVELAMAMVESEHRDHIRLLQYFYRSIQTVKTSIITGPSIWSRLSCRYGISISENVSQYFWSFTPKTYNYSMKTFICKISWQEQREGRDLTLGWRFCVGVDLNRSSKAVVEQAGRHSPASRQPTVMSQTEQLWAVGGELAPAWHPSLPSLARCGGYNWLPSSHSKSFIDHHTKQRHYNQYIASLWLMISRSSSAGYTFN